MDDKLLHEHGKEGPTEARSGAKRRDFRAAWRGAKPRQDPYPEKDPRREFAHKKSK